jgi:hypothetical protein
MCARTDALEQLILTGNGRMLVGRTSKNMKSQSMLSTLNEYMTTVDVYLYAIVRNDLKTVQSVYTYRSVCSARHPITGVRAAAHMHNMHCRREYRFAYGRVGRQHRRVACAVERACA